MQWDVEPVAAQMTQMASDLTARIDALDPESESPVFSDFSFAIATGDWELTNGLYKARVTNTVLLTANAGIQVFYDQTLRTSVVGDIFEDKHTGYIDFYTTIMPTGSVTGFIRVIDATGGNVQISRGGTGASTPKGARTNLNVPIRDIPINFGTVSSLPQTIYDADLTTDMVAFDAVFSNPAAVPAGIDVTFAAGSVTITGTLVTGQETDIKFWAHEQRSVVEGTETPAEQQRITEFVQVQAQTLTTAQQLQARTNIGAADASDVACNRIVPKSVYSKIQIIANDSYAIGSLVVINLKCKTLESMGSSVFTMSLPAPINPDSVAGNTTIKLMNVLKPGGEVINMTMLADGRMYNQSGVSVNEDVTFYISGIYISSPATIASFIEA